jgi:two-component system response regulator YesN
VTSEIGWVGANTLLWLIQPGRGTAFARSQAVIKGTAENIQRLCTNILHIRISFVFDPGPVGWNELPERFSQLRFIAANRLDKQPDIALAELDYFLGKPFSGDDYNDQFAVKYKNLAKKLSLCMSLGDSEGLHQAADEFVLRLFSEEGKKDGEMDLLEFHTSLNLILLSYLNQQGLRKSLRYDNPFRLFLSDTMNNDVVQRIQRFVQIADQLLEINNQEHKQTSDILANRVLSYIHENLSADLSLYALSEKVFLNSSYLSRRFKEATGRNISDTVTDLRISEACRLLRQGSYRISRISAIVGYESPAYFSRIFKRKMGLTPQEYRDRLYQK